MPYATRRTPEEVQAFHGERVEARQAERNVNAGRGSLDYHVSLDETPEELSARLDDHFVKLGILPPKGHPFEGPLLAAALLDVLAFNALASALHEEPATQERIDPIDANDPPFFRFWKKLNAKLVAAGNPEAGYKVARDAFNGGETPEGALTFIGKEWEGLRAVPTSDGDYAGEFRTATEDGTRWNVVHTRTGTRHYASAEGALKGAKLARQHSEDHS